MLPNPLPNRLGFEPGSFVQHVIISSGHLEWSWHLAAYFLTGSRRVETFSHRNPVPPVRKSCETIRSVKHNFRQRPRDGKLPIASYFAVN